jgi:hypothetical protein
MSIARALLLCTLALAASAAQAVELELPLRVPLEALREALAAHLAAASRGTGALYREGRCRYLTLGAPALAAAEGRLRVSAPGTAALGLELLGQCQNAAAWRGTVQLTLVPVVDAAGRLRLRVVDSQVSDESGSPAPGLIWEMSKRYVHPYLERFAYDLGPLRESLLAVARSAAPEPYREALAQVLAQVRLLPPRIATSDLVVPVAVELPDAWLAAAPPAASAEPLSEAELEALDRALEPWDAFLVYAVKQLALDSPDPALRARLFTLLLDSRYRLSAILSGEERTAGDPLQALFVDAWTELRELIREAERAGLLNGSLVRYVAFMDAGDALLALERAAPGLRLRPSADGLRRLARSLRPSAGGDPLAYDQRLDPELGTLFGVPALPDAPAAPPRTTSWLDLVIRSAHAAGERPLDRWVPTRAELDLYQERVAALLRESAARELGRGELAAPYDAMFRDLLPATALIESCWRQYVVRNGKATYLRSASRSVGMMQVNQRVWRGFYDVQRLRWDTAYNVRAGAQILMRYLKDYAIPYATRGGSPELAPRAVYAVYNAGPRAVGRFDKEKPHPREKRVDDRFWSLYRAIAAGASADLRSCSVAEAPAAE